jgi:hypothetical protein
MRLAECTNQGIVPPIIVAQMLKLLDAPKMTSRSSCEDIHFSKSNPAMDSCSNMSTTDAEQNEDLGSDCSSYESDFESESGSDISDSGSIAEDLQIEDDGAEEDDTPIAQYDPTLAFASDSQCINGERPEDARLGNEDEVF